MSSALMQDSLDADSELQSMLKSLLLAKPA